MKLRSLVNFSIMSEDTLVGFFYAVSNEDPPPFHQRDNLYHQVDWDEYSVSSDDEWTSILINEEKIKLMDVMKAVQDNSLS